MPVVAMPKDITSVYVPVKTPDHTVMAVLAAVLVHIGVLGFIIYTNHTKSINEPPMQMSLVTPEQLAMIQGQAAANRRSQAAQTNANTTVNNPTPATDPAMVSVNNALAARQAKWQREQAAYAAQLDKQAMQDQQNFNNQIKQVQMSHVAELNKLKVLQANPETNPPLATPPAAKSPPSRGGENGIENRKGETSPNGNRGTKASKGTSSNDYKNQIFAIINGNWSPPHNSNGNRLVAHFTISPSGDITIIEISGDNNEAFKNSLIQALNASSPLPSPPTDSYNDFADNQLTFTTQKK